MIKNRWLKSTLSKGSFIALIGLSSVGCISQKSYVDPQYRHATYSDLMRVDPPYALSIKAEYQLNGKTRPGAERGLIDHVERSLRASGVVVPYDGKGVADGQLSIVVNDEGSLGAAAAKGFGTGLTFGLIGSHVTDSFAVSVTLTQPTGVTQRQYSHAIMSTIGNASGPAGLQPVAMGTAMNQIADDVVLNFLKDAQNSGLLTPKLATAAITQIH